ncbi:MAG: hypothetical protein IJZ75_05635 [Clostridia bacterium]|nr:hypothetical protein [Clostridia bacterium]
MDTFFEQIVVIKKTAKDIVLLGLIWLLALAISVFAFLFLSGIGLILMMLSVYGAFKLSNFFFNEYEYIITNGIMDVDKIIAKSSRKREASFDLTKVDRLEKYNPNMKIDGKFQKTVFACNKDDENAYLLTADNGKILLVFAPDERIKSAVIKYVPKFLSNSAFK